MKQYPSKEEWIKSVEKIQSIIKDLKFTDKILLKWSKHKQNENRTDKRDSEPNQ